MDSASAEAGLWRANPSNFMNRDISTKVTTNNSPLLPGFEYFQIRLIAGDKGNQNPLTGDSESFEFLKLLGIKTKNYI